METKTKSKHRHLTAKEIKIDQWRQKGYTVKIRHYRIHDPKISDRGFSGNIMTKGQFIKAIEKGEVISRKYNDSVMPKGGFTIVEIIDNKTGMKYSGKFNFNGSRFHRRRGFEAAFNRAAQQLPERA